MTLTLRDPIDAYLGQSEIIDWHHPAVAAQAKALRRERDEVLDIARRTFEFVRDEIRHSYDFRMNPVTCAASEVLEARTGYCYAKSHLLAALLRANGISAGLCYQRLSLDGEKPPFSLHGLNAVLLPDHGWYRIDARGNKPGVDAQFNPPAEQLAFNLCMPGEGSFADIFANPLPQVVQVLRTCRSFDEVWRNLPDADPGAPLASTSE